MQLKRREDNLKKKDKELINLTKKPKVSKNSRAILEKQRSLSIESFPEEVDEGCRARQRTDYRTPIFNNKAKKSHKPGKPSANFQSTEIINICSDF